MDKTALKNFSNLVRLKKKIPSQTATAIYWWELLRFKFDGDIDGLFEIRIRLDSKPADWTPWQKITYLLISSKDLALESGLFLSASGSMPHWQDLSEFAKNLLSFQLFEYEWVRIGTAEIVPQDPDKQLKYLKSRYPDQEDEWQKMIPKKWKHLILEPHPIDLQSDSVFAFDLIIDLSKEKSEILERIEKQLDFYIKTYRRGSGTSEQSQPLPCNEKGVVGKTDLKQLLAYFELVAFGSFSGIPSNSHTYEGIYSSESSYKTAAAEVERSIKAIEDFRRYTRRKWGPS